MPDVVVGPIAAALWIVVVRRRNSALRKGPEQALWFVLTMFACAVTLQVSWSWLWVDRAAASLGGAAWAGLCLAVLAAAGARSFTVRTAPDQRPRFRRLHLPLTLAGLAAVTLSFNDHQERSPSPTASFVALKQAEFYQGGPAAALRWSVWLGLLTWVLADAVQVTTRYADEARLVEGWRPHMRSGLALGAIGCRIGYGYVALKALVTAGWTIGFGPHLAVLDETADMLACLSVAMILIAATYNTTATRAVAARQTMRQLLAWHRLRPLSITLYRAVPHGAAQLSGWTPRQRLSRRVLGIRDRQLALRPYIDAGTPRHALEAALDAGYAGTEARAAAEAAWLVTALLAKARGLPPVTDVPYDLVYEVTGGRDLNEEAAWLLGVSAHREGRFVHYYGAARVHTETERVGI